MKNKIKVLFVMLFASLLLLPVMVKAEGNVAIIESLDQEYATLEEALTAASTASDKKVMLIQNVTLDSDLTIPSGVQLYTTTNTLEIPDGKTLTVSGTLIVSGTGDVKVGGNLSIESGSILQIDSTVSVLGTGQLQLKSLATVNINKAGSLDLAVNSKIVTDSSGKSTMNLEQRENMATYSVTGNANAFDTAGNLTVNNYGGRLSETISNKIVPANYNYYPIKDKKENKFYKTLDEVLSDEVYLISNLTVNGDTQLRDTITLYMEPGTVLKVNGTLDIEGKIDMSLGYASLVADYLYGCGTIVIAPATDMEECHWTYVTILHDVENRIRFQAKEGYDPKPGDILFEIGTNEKEAIAIAAKITLGSTFHGYVINPKDAELCLSHDGHALGVIAGEITDKVVDEKNPQTGTKNTFILGLISIAAVICAAFCARRIYILNRI